MTTYYIPRISIHLILLFTGREGIYTYLNKEWKAEYIHLYGHHKLSTSIIRTAERYRWATRQGGYFSYNRDVSSIWKNRIESHDMDLAYLLLQYSKYSTVMCALHRSDTHLYDAIIMHLSANRTRHELFIFAFQKSVEYNNLSFLKRVCDLDIKPHGFETISYEITQEAARHQKIEIVLYLLRTRAFGKGSEENILMMSLMYGHVKMASCLLAMGIQYRRDMLMPIIMNNKRESLELLILKDIVRVHDVSYMMTLANQSNAIDICLCILENNLLSLIDAQDAWIEAKEYGNHECVSYLEGYIEVLCDAAGEPSIIYEN